MPKRRASIKVTSKKIRLKKLLFYAAGLLLMILFFFAFADYSQIVIDYLLPYKILLAFFGGLLYTSFLTTPFGVIIFYSLGPHMNPLEMALIGGVGAMISDVFIVKSFQKLLDFLAFSGPDHFIHQLKDFFKKFHLNIVALILGAIIIMLPIPDEPGLILLGASRLSPFRLSILLFIMNSVGIFLIASLARVT